MRKNPRLSALTIGSVALGFTLVVSGAYAESEQRASSGGDIFGFGSVETVKSRLSENGSSKSSNAGMVELIKTRDSLCIVRSAQWGMSRTDIQRIESARLVESSDAVLTYRERLGETICLITYTFAADKLRGIHIEFHEPTSDPHQYYKEFEDVSLRLCKTAGVPDTKNYHWVDETYRNDRSKWGLSIAEGDLTCHLAWETSRSRIELKSRGADSVFSTTITFSPR